MDTTTGRNAVELLAATMTEINQRRVALLRELAELDASLKTYGIDPRHLTNNRTDNQAHAAETSTSGMAAGNKPRTRRKPPTTDWIIKQLVDGKRSQPELTRRATASGYSGTAMVAVLRKGRDRFKWERSPHQKSQRGMPPVIWSLCD